MDSDHPPVPPWPKRWEPGIARSLAQPGRRPRPVSDGVGISCAWLRPTSIVPSPRYIPPEFLSTTPMMAC